MRDNIITLKLRVAFIKFDIAIGEAKDVTMKILQT